MQVLPAVFSNKEKAALFLAKYQWTLEYIKLILVFDLRVGEFCQPRRSMHPTKKNMKIDFTGFYKLQVQ